MQKENCGPDPRLGWISVANAKERLHWANAFAVTEPVLLHAVKIVGPSVHELRKLFCVD
jgi:hypothetical protein